MKIEIYVNQDVDKGFYGHLYINDVLFCDVLVGFEKNGKFPYKYDYNYTIKHCDIKEAFAIIDHSDMEFNHRGFQIHIGNSYKDTKGCVLLGHANGCLELFEPHEWLKFDSLYLSRSTFRKFEFTEQWHRLSLEKIYKTQCEHVLRFYKGQAPSIDNYSL